MLNEYPLRDEDGDINPENALMHLLADSAIFLNDHWWQRDWPRNAQSTISLNVNCSDTFAYASADAEPVLWLEFASLVELYEMDQVWGPIAWCIQKRKCRPIKPVEDELILAGFDVEELIRRGSNEG